MAQPSLGGLLLEPDDQPAMSLVKENSAEPDNATSVTAVTAGNAGGGRPDGRRRRSGIGRIISRTLDPATLFGIASVLVALAIVEGLVRLDIVSPVIIARPSDAIAGLFVGDLRAELFHGAELTFALVGAALILEICIAVPLGYFLYRYRDFGLAYEGWLAALFAAPIFLLYPLFMVIFGRNDFTLIFMGFASGVIPIITHVRAAFMSVPETLIKVGKSFSLSDAAIFRQIILPSGAPTIFAGIRLGLLYTLINIVAVEYLVDAGGLGRIVSDRYYRFDVIGTYTAIIAIALVSILANAIVNRLEKLVR